MTHQFLASRWSLAAIMVASAAVFALLVLINPSIALLVALLTSALPLLIYFLARDALTPTLATLLVLPLHNSPFLNPNLMGIQGMKPFNLIAACAVFAALLSWLTRRGTDRVETKIMLIFFVYWAVWTIEFLRSLENYEYIRYAIKTEVDRGISSYALSFYVRPSLFAFLFPTILVLARSERALHRTLRVLCASVFILSCAVFAVVLANVSTFAAGRDAMNVLFETSLGLHYNSIGTMYVVATPLVLFAAIQWGWFWKINLVSALIAVLLIGSRSALLVVVLGIVTTLILQRRVGVALAGTMTLFGLIAMVAAPSVSALFSVGVQPGGDMSVDGLLNGRETLFWIPLLNEWWEDPFRFWFGSGLFGILTSQLGLTNRLFGVTHAHNGLINFFLDSGIVLTSILVYCVAVGMIWAARIGRQIKDPMYWSLYVGIGAYLVSTLTERGFYPSYDNVLVFPILALTVNVARSHLRQREPQSEYDPNIRVARARYA